MRDLAQRISQAVRRTSDTDQFAFGAFQQGRGRQNV
jgi:hypothetical protein